MTREINRYARMTLLLLAGMVLAILGVLFFPGGPRIIAVAALILAMATPGWRRDHQAAARHPRRMRPAWPTTQSDGSVSVCSS
jgi:hypothetical protein